MKRSFGPHYPGLSTTYQLGCSSNQLGAIRYLIFVGQRDSFLEQNLVKQRSKWLDFLGSTHAFDAFDSRCTYRKLSLEAKQEQAWDRLEMRGQSFTCFFLPLSIWDLKDIQGHYMQRSLGNVRSLGTNCSSCCSGNVVPHTWSFGGAFSRV